MGNRFHFDEMDYPALGDGQQDARFQPARSPEKTGEFKK
jgi:hypothetical protein